MGALLILIGVVLVVAAVVFCSFHPPRGGWYEEVADFVRDGSLIDQLGWLTVICFTLGEILYGVWMIMKTLGAGKVLVFNDGLVYIGDGQSEVWRWDDIAHVWHEVKVDYGEGMDVSLHYYITARRRPETRF
jgi:hypothetical protein